MTILLTVFFVSYCISVCIHTLGLCLDLYPLHIEFTQPKAVFYIIVKSALAVWIGLTLWGG